MKIPGPDHPITIAPAQQRIRVSVDGLVLAETANALTLREASYSPVHYIPRADVDMTRLTRTDHTTRCPYKGDASYFSIRTSDRALDNAVWSYETPYPAVQAIAGYLAFYPDLVAIEPIP